MVERQTITVGGRDATTPTKTGEARTVALPATVVGIMREHLAARPVTFGKAPLFARPDGRPVSRSQLQWRKATKALDLQQHHPYSVRHSGLTAVAQAGATLCEIIDRAELRTAKAALIHKHVDAENGQVIASGIYVTLTEVSGTTYGTHGCQSGLGTVRRYSGD